MERKGTGCLNVLKMNIEQRQYELFGVLTCRKDILAQVLGPRKLAASARSARTMEDIPNNRHTETQTRSPV